MPLVAVEDASCWGSVTELLCPVLGARSLWLGEAVGPLRGPTRLAAPGDHAGSSVGWWLSELCTPITMLSHGPRSFFPRITAVPGCFSTPPQSCVAGVGLEDQEGLSTVVCGGTSSLWTCCGQTVGDLQLRSPHPAPLFWRKVS